MLWNEHLRKKPKNCTEVCGVEAYDTIKKLIEENTNVQIFTGGKRYTGGVSGSGNSWTLAGVKTYESIRKKLVSDMEDFKNIHFNYKKQEEKIGLTETVNNQDSEEFQAMLFDGEVNIDDILASGKFSAA